MDENLHILAGSSDIVATATYYKNMLDAYAWHFRIKERPATFMELVKFARWEGLQLKTPTTKELVDFFLDKKIVF